MLSRHAEHLFWAGRYIERATDTARMLDVTYHGLLGSAPAESRQGWLDLLQVLHVDELFSARHQIVDARTVSAFLVQEPDNPGALVPAINRARSNARSVRELMSTELWESINTFWLELSERDLARDLDQQPYELYGLVRRRCQEVIGTATETMLHDDGYRFFMLGSMLERAEMTCRLLNVRFAPFTDGQDELNFHHAVQVLRSASASEAFRRAHPAAMTLQNVMEFLLMNETFPRSVLFCLSSAERMLTELDVPGRRSRALQVLGRRKADLAFTDVAELLSGDVHASLDALQLDVRRAAELVAIQFFRHTEEFSVFHSVASVA